MKEEVVVNLKDDSRESRNNGMIENVEIKGLDFETEFDFWPIQHPTEPSREDRPVQCPMPHSSQLSNVSVFLSYTCASVRMCVLKVISDIKQSDITSVVT